MSQSYPPHRLIKIILLTTLFILDASPPRRFLNFKIDNIRVLDEAKHPHMVRSPLSYLICRNSTSVLTLTYTAIDHRWR